MVTVYVVWFQFDGCNSALCEGVTVCCFSSLLYSSNSLDHSHYCKSHNHKRTFLILRSLGVLIAISGYWHLIINVYPSNTPPRCPRLCLWILNMKEFVYSHDIAYWCTLWTIPVYSVHPSLWPDGHVSTAWSLCYDIIKSDPRSPLFCCICSFCGKVNGICRIVPWYY